MLAERLMKRISESPALRKAKDVHQNMTEVDEVDTVSYNHAPFSQHEGFKISCSRSPFCQHEAFDMLRSCSILSARRF